MPCDVSISLSGQDIYFTDFDFAMAPRRPIGTNNTYDEQRLPSLITEVLPNETRRMRERFLLPGRLVKWYTAYGKAPEDNSWVWDWYPDGDVWRQGVQEHGSNVVRTIASRYLLQ